jgi:YbbR domain-containing protein
MQQSRPLTLRQAVVSNALWFVGSLALAFLIWMTASAQRDPIEERRLSERATIQFALAENMLIAQVSSDSVALRVRGQRSALSLLTADDITINADLTALAPGTHQVELTATTRRERITVDTIPRQVAVTIELLGNRLVPVRVEIIGEPPPGYEYDAAEYETLEVNVSGAASAVEQVDAAVLSLDLTAQRSDLTTTARLTAIDLENTVVESVMLNPDVVVVTVPVRQRPDVREVSVQPNLIGVDNLPLGYLFTSLSYEPRSVLVSGSPDLLNSLPETFFTAPIDLSNRTTDFEMSVPVVLPARELVILSGQTITVSLNITAQTASRQFDDVPVEIIGLSEGLEATLSPASVTLLITGPQPVLSDIVARDVRVILDVNNLAAGGYQLTPQPALAQGLPDGTTISVLPASLDVQIVANSE